MNIEGLATWVRESMECGGKQSATPLWLGTVPDDRRLNHGHPPPRPFPRVWSALDCTSRLLPKLLTQPLDLMQEI